jgi:hypothetical protein
MHARVPQDVDLEDRLLFGLTATRFGELALAALAALAAWRVVPWVGGSLATLLLAGGAALGWGRWRGRGADHWLVSVVLFAVRTHRLQIDNDGLRWCRTAVARWGRQPKRVLARGRPSARVRPALRVLDGPAE